MTDFRTASGFTASIDTLFHRVLDHCALVEYIAFCLAGRRAVGSVGEGVTEKDRENSHHHDIYTAQHSGGAENLQHNRQFVWRAEFLNADGPLGWDAFLLFFRGCS